MAANKHSHGIELVLRNFKSHHRAITIKGDLTPPMGSAERARKFRLLCHMMENNENVNIKCSVLLNGINMKLTVD